MLSKLTFLKILLLSLLFTGALFLFQTYFSIYFSDTLAEENYIEKSIYDDVSTQEPLKIEKEIIDIKTMSPLPETQKPSSLKSSDKQDLSSATQKEVKQIFFTYIPVTLRTSIRNYRNISRDFIGGSNFEDKIHDLTVEFHEDMVDVRGKMKNKTIKIFDPLRMGTSEFLALFTHEFAHYLDLYHFSKNPFGDISEDFYSISWDSTKTMKRGQKQSDFVSGYAMTNKYEDFAESLTYYIFHNKDFEQKAVESDVLDRKYNFFYTQLFDNASFVGTDFSSGKIKNYYWDITKIEIDDENFLQYLKNDI